MGSTKKWKKPRKVKIGALTFKIKYVKPGKGVELKENETGCICQEKQLIEIDKNASEQYALLVLVHEILHGVGDAMSPQRSPFAKEDFTCTVAELLTNAMSSANLLPNVSNGSPHSRHGKRISKR